MCPQCKLASSEEDERQTKIAEDLGRAMREMGEEEPGW